jgi:membrane protease YdiL (CAAX protease family)
MILAETAFLIVLLVVFPWVAWRSFPAVMRTIADGVPGARVREYRRAAAWQWALCVAGAALWIAGGRTWEELGFGAPGGRGFWVALGIAGVAAALLQAQLVSVRRSGDARREVRSRLGGSMVFLPRSRAEGAAFLGISATAGICEEMLYRGWLLGWLAPRIGLPAAFAAAAVLFALAHAYGGRKLAARAGALGVVLGALYVLSGSLWVSIALHVFLDANAGQLSVAAHSDAPAPEREVAT